MTMDNCEDRCDYVPCRFMVDPCQNFGMCLVPKTAAGVSPEYGCYGLLRISPTRPGRRSSQRNWGLGWEGLGLCLSPQ